MQIGPLRNHLFLACLVSSPSQGVWGLTLDSGAHVLVQSLPMGQASQPIDTVDLTQRSPCSHAHFGGVTTACVSSPRDWDVPAGSLMQQDMFFLRRSTSKRTDRSRQQAVLGTCCSACLRGTTVIVEFHMEKTHLSVRDALF